VLRGGCIPVAHGPGDLVVEVDRAALRLRGHQVVVGAALERPLDQPGERGEHVVAARLEQRAVEALIGPEVRLEVTAATGGHHVGDGRGQLAALLGGGALRGQGGGGRLDAAAQLGQ